MIGAVIIQVNEVNYLSKGVRLYVLYYLEDVYNMVNTSDLESVSASILHVAVPLTTRR
jgi:hypothetical protein